MILSLHSTDEKMALRDTAFEQFWMLTSGSMGTKLRLSNFKCIIFSLLHMHLLEDNSLIYLIDIFSLIYIVISDK